MENSSWYEMLCDGVEWESSDSNYVNRILKIIAKNDAFSGVFWDEECNFYVNCSDLFQWGGSDAEKIQEKDIPLLEKSFKDSPYNGLDLFCCRMRKMRPQGAFYTYLEEEEKSLFEECGSERLIELEKPY